MLYKDLVDGLQQHRIFGDLALAPAARRGQLTKLLLGMGQPFFQSGGLLIGVVGCAGAPMKAPLTVYSNDFDTEPSFAGGTTGGLSGVTTTEGVQNLPSPFSGNFLRNDTTGNPAAATTLTLNNLPAHDSVNINFILAFIDSWDGTGLPGAPAGVAPDWFNVVVDGTEILRVTNNVYSRADSDFGGGKEIDGGKNFGWDPAQKDWAVDMGTAGALSFPHSSSNLTVSFFADGAGWQGGADESWGIDNLNVVVNTTEEIP